ncbi:MAG TPA: hypothetical protein VFI43_02175, partial [Nitrosospira sp.]|nr:hypothetical protein [Nitrosospira sp.]
DTLDQKLWVALSCPTRGIEFDSRTLDLIDSDHDARVHANEVLGAITWAGRLLKNPDLLVSGSDYLSLAEINDGTEEGQDLTASAQYILKSLGKPEATEISISDLDDIEKFVAGLEFNGDGVIDPLQVKDAKLRATIEDIIACRGSVPNADGKAGISQEICDAFFAEVTAYVNWLDSADGDTNVHFLGEKTTEAGAAFNAVKDKVNDYFTRCRLAAYDPRAAIPLSRSAEDYERIAAENLSAQNPDIADFPLATVEAGKPLPLRSEINPAWQGRIAALREQAINPILGEKENLSASEWEDLCIKFAPFEAWQEAKTTCCAERLGDSRLREIARSGDKEKIDHLISQDKAVEGEVKSIQSVEKLLRFHRDLFKLVNNFVSFRSFYTGRDKAMFQLGTLYLDSRSCDLCVRVDDVAKHAEYANMSGIFLAYCECVRKDGAEKMNIAAAFTDGDSDFLMVGRNGIFYDRRGRDWDATIVRILDHPISIRQAFWSPYKKLVKFISEQMEKMAAARAAAADEKLLKTAAEAAKPVAEGTPPPPTPARQAFDVGKFAGIFAAIGLALGAIGGVLATIVSGILSLRIWEIPLAIIGLILLISLPSMLIAWFKLKKRNLGPILDANGWAINARARINIPFGKSLTEMAVLPEGSRRSLVDPYADRKPIWPYYLLIAAAVIAALVTLWYFGVFGNRTT